MASLTEQEIFHQIISAWQENIKFREEFKKNPQAALQNVGIEVTPEVLAKIESKLKLKDDGKLDDRISK